MNTKEINETIKLKKELDEKINKLVEYKYVHLLECIESLGGVFSTSNGRLNSIRNDSYSDIPFEIILGIGGEPYLINFELDRELNIKIINIGDPSECNVSYEACKFIYKLQKELDNINNNESEES